MITMFGDAIEFLNNIGDIQRALAKEDNEDPLRLIQAVVNIGNYSDIKGEGCILRNCICTF